jgi:hypothetical protein
MAKKRTAKEKKYAKVTREEKRKPKHLRRTRKQIAGKVEGMMRRGRRGA